MSASHTSDPAPASPERRQLRLAMRRQRNATPLPARRAAAHAVAGHLARAQLFVRNARIAVYEAFDGEIDLRPTVARARRAGCALYAPHIVDMRARRMHFVELSKIGTHARLQRRIDPRMLDVVLVPLVAFDVHGWRLGFGAGFYDRKFAFMRRGPRNKPLLIGIGYEFQRVPAQHPEPWDVSLHAVATERGLYRVRARHTR
jgi:5-formyltetrahydrofolate cyclo-ligase